MGSPTKKGKRTMKSIAQKAIMFERAFGKKKSLMVPGAQAKCQSAVRISVLPDKEGTRESVMPVAARGRESVMPVVTTTTAKPASKKPRRSLREIVRKSVIGPLRICRAFSKGNPNSVLFQRARAVANQQKARDLFELARPC